MEQANRVTTTTILWVRFCNSCSGIDRRDWFEEPEEATQRDWACPHCGEADYALLLTRW